jgi:hypothetical protein
MFVRPMVTEPDQTTNGAIQSSPTQNSNHTKARIKRSTTPYLVNFRGKKFFNNKDFPNRLLDGLIYRAAVDQILSTNTKNFRSKSSIGNSEQNQHQRLATCAHQQQSSRFDLPRSIS